jgi:iron(II)-dependent oxidoreductase
MERRGKEKKDAQPAIGMREIMNTGNPEPPDLPPGMEREGDHYVSLGDRAAMVWIPEGPFYMGQPEEELFAKPHEKPGRQVHLPGYFMDIYPVTNRQYALFIRDHGYERSEFWPSPAWQWVQSQGIHQPVGWDHEKFRGEDQPAAGVSWYEARAYARWADKRLPTEAQWEKAARGSDGRRFPWGREFPNSSLANFDDLAKCTTPVNAFPAGISPHGCMDMAGNVNNWCLDWYWDGFYAWCVKEGVNASPRLDADLCKSLEIRRRYKVDRGGGFATTFQFCEIMSCSDKVAWPPMTRNLWNGFRCVIQPGS